MNKEMYKLITDNYTSLFNNYIKNQNKYKITNSKSCEDIFNEKILFFLELDLPPKIETLLYFLKTKRKDNIYIQKTTTDTYIKTIEYKEYYQTDEDEIDVSKIKDLFIDYRKEIKKR